MYEIYLVSLVLCHWFQIDWMYIEKNIYVLKALENYKEYVN